METSPLKHLQDKKEREKEKKKGIRKKEVLGFEKL